MPTQHEREIYSTRINEIFYSRIFLFLFAIVFSVVLIITLKAVLVTVLLILAFIIFFPFFIKPWEIILTNKRLVIRHLFWNIARFSTIKSFDLNKLDSQRITPRIKVIPITLGFTLIFNYSFVLLDYVISNELPAPLIFKFLFLFENLFPIIAIINLSIQELVFKIFAPFLPLAFFFAMTSFLLGMGLILFGMPREEEMVLTTTGGHRFNINAGIPPDLTDMLYAVGRKHRVMKEEVDWNWEVPLLDDEEIKITSKVGLIDRGSQLLGLVGLLIFLESLDQTVKLITAFSLGNLILLLIRLFQVFFLFLAVILAKKYRRITATNHRLIYQEERKEISGLWGKRVFQYNDLPYKYLQGFRYSNFSGISASSILGIIILFLGGITISMFYNSILAIVITIFVILGYGVISFKITTLLEFKSLGGDVIRLFYRLPFFMSYLSHRLEENDWIYNRLFPTILSEEEIVVICNSIRSVENPVEDPTIAHKVTYRGFIDTSEEILYKWEKIGPFKYAKESVITGTILSLILIIYFISQIEFSLRLPFAIISILFVFIVSLRFYVFKRRSLIILDNRLFHIDEILPRRLAQAFGVLPERSISEVDLKFVLVSQFKFFIGERWPFFVKNGLLFIVLIASVIALYNSPSSSIIPINLIIVLLYLIIVVFTPILVRDLFGTIPRYGLNILTRFGSIKFPYLNKLESFTHVFQEAR